jgi:hypothetical protein
MKSREAVSKMNKPNSTYLSLLRRGTVYFSKPKFR